MPKQPYTHKCNPIRRERALAELRDEKAEKKKIQKKKRDHWEEYSLSTYNVSLCALGNLVLVRSRSKVVVVVLGVSILPSQYICCQYMLFTTMLNTRNESKILALCQYLKTITFFLKKKKDECKRGRGSKK
jgi:hypothetical protein